MFELSPWPREGETWEPCLPWPEDAPPADYSVSRYRGGYLVYAPSGSAEIGIARAERRWRGCVVAWEHRYGEARFDPFEEGGELFLRADHAAEAASQRRGSGPVLIEVVGGEHVFVRCGNGLIATVPARDLRRAFRRVGGAT